MADDYFRFLWLSRLGWFVLISVSIIQSVRFFICLYKTHRDHKLYLPK